MTGRDFNSGTVSVSRLEERRGWLGRARAERQPPANAWRDEPRAGEDTKERAA